MFKENKEKLNFVDKNLFQIEEIEEIRWKKSIEESREEPENWINSNWNENYYSSPEKSKF